MIWILWGGMMPNLVYESDEPKGYCFVLAGLGE